MNAKRWRVVKVILGIFSGVVLLGALVVVILGITPPRIPVTPSGELQMQSVYIPMSDGTNIAIRLSLPPDLEEGQQIPTVIEATRYQTDMRSTFLLNLIMNISGDTKANLMIGNPLMEAGYAFVRVDARGSGASFGSRDVEWSQQEIEDIGEVIDWVVSQSWSNQRVGTYGVSYSGNTAELAVALNHPNLMAAAPLYSDFDYLVGNVMPGGIKNAFILENWSALVADYDANIGNSIFNGGIAPVDEDHDESLLEQALAERDNINIGHEFQTVTYYDDPITDAHTARSLSPFHYKDDIQQANVPFYVRVGWLDAGTVDGAIARFFTYENLQQLVIGPWNHSGSFFYDPLLVDDGPETSLVFAQDRAVIAFFDDYLKSNEENVAPPPSEISYYTMGEGEWHTTSVWPVEGTTETAFYFHPDGSLQESLPTGHDDTNQYAVDFTATTGAGNRWFTQLGGPPIDYPDRAEEDQMLLAYTSEPLSHAVEITGNPVATLNLSSTATDGAFYVYLEAVAPDGRVIYITEGQLRGLHRNETTRDLGYTNVGPRHSYEREDGQAMIPCEPLEMNIGLLATSVLVPQGYRLRIAIAGHDASIFESVAEDEQPIIEVQTNDTLPSFVTLPMVIRD